MLRELHNLRTFDSSNLAVGILPHQFFDHNERLQTVTFISNKILRDIPSVQRTRVEYMRLQANSQLRLHGKSCHVRAATLRKLALVANPKVTALPASFLGPYSMEDVIISDNAALSLVHKEAFAGVSMKRLVIQVANASFQLEEGAFEKSNKILSLAISGCDVGTLQARGALFAGLEDTEHVTLVGSSSGKAHQDVNGSTSVWPSNMFDELRGVRSLELRKQAVRSAAPLLFSKLTRLESLSLVALNNMGVLGEHGSLFAESNVHLNTLKIVSMGTLARIQPGFFAGLGRLRVLDLSRNDAYQRIEPLVFDGIGNRDVEFEIILQESSLKHVSRRAFNFDARGLSATTTVELGSRTSLASAALSSCCGYHWLKYAPNFVISDLYCGHGKDAMLLSQSTDANCCISAEQKAFVRDLGTVARIPGNNRYAAMLLQQDTLPPCNSSASTSSKPCLERKNITITSKLAAVCEGAVRARVDVVADPNCTKKGGKCSIQEKAVLDRYWFEDSWPVMGQRSSGRCLTKCPDQYHEGISGALRSLECEPWEHGGSKKYDTHFYVRERTCFPCAVQNCKTCDKDARVCGTCMSGYNAYHDSTGDYCIAQRPTLAQGALCQPGWVPTTRHMDNEAQCWVLTCSEPWHRQQARSFKAAITVLVLCLVLFAVLYTLRVQLLRQLLEDMGRELDGTMDGVYKVKWDLPDGYYRRRKAGRAQKKATQSDEEFSNPMFDGSDGEEIQDSIKPVEWSWQETKDHLSLHDRSKVLAGTTFVRFSHCVTMELEEAYGAFKGGKGPAIITIDLENRIASTGTEQKAVNPDSGTKYTISFGKMTQKNEKTGYKRCLDRNGSSQKQATATTRNQRGAQRRQPGPRAKTMGRERLPTVIPYNSSNDAFEDGYNFLAVRAGQLIQVTKERDEWLCGRVLHDPNPSEGGVSSGWFPRAIADVAAAVDLQDIAGVFTTGTGAAGEEGQVGASLLNPPKTWDNADAQGDTQAHLRRVTDEAELAKVVGWFNRSQDGGLDVLEVQRVENLPMWQSFVVKKQTMLSRTCPPLHNKGALSRKWLFHGTSPQTVPLIAQQGFNRSFAGKNAVAYGRGIYFAKDASYSCQPQYSQVDRKGRQFLFLCRVAVGDWSKGHNDQLTPAIKPGSGHELFDSTVDHVGSPSIYVTYHDAQAYPEYLLTLKRK